MNHPLNNAYPGKLQAISIVQTAVGSLQILYGILYFIYIVIIGVASFGIGLIALPLPILVFAAGVLALISGIKGLQQRPSYGLMLTASIFQLVCILACDVLGFGAGLATMILIFQPEVKAFFGRS